MSYFHYQLAPREAAYGRLVANVLGTLRRAIERRVKEGHEKGEIAKRAELSAGHLSRVLNGNVSNVTLRTVSDLLWAADFDPQDFTADPIEELSANGASCLSLPAKPTSAQTASVLASSGCVAIDLTANSRPVATSTAL